MQAVWPARFKDPPRHQAQVLKAARVNMLDKLSPLPPRFARFATREVARSALHETSSKLDLLMPPQFAEESLRIWWHWLMVALAVCLAQRARACH